MTPTQLYRHFDACDRLLYVGISADAWKRLQQHFSRSPWGKDIARMTVEDHPTRGAAVDAEAAAILSEQPPFNKAGLEQPLPAPLPDAIEMARFEEWLARERSPT
jgi:hypothetical protein